MSRKRIKKNISYDDIRKLYYVTLQFGYKDGKQVRQIKTTTNLKMAEKLLREHEKQKDDNALVMPEKTTLDEFLQEWLNTIVKFSNAKTTYYAYQNIIKHVTEYMGDIPLQDIKAKNIQDYFTFLLEIKKLSNNTVIKHYNLLNTALKFALQQERIMTNPCWKVRVPAKVKPKINFYTLDELIELFQKLKGDRLEIIVYLAAFFGLRREEILGLTWDTVDFKNNCIYIENARTSAGSEIVIKDPKNNTSVRKLTMDDDIKNLLQKEYQKQKYHRKILRDLYIDTDFVVVMDNGKPYRPNYVSEIFTKFINDNNLKKITLHGLRHSTASWASNIGIPLYELSKFLGHSTPDTTGRMYVHLYSDAHANAVQSLSASLKEKMKEKAK